MPIKPRTNIGTGDYEKIKPGTHPAVCIGVWDLGLQTTTWQGKEKQQYKILIAWKTNEKDAKGNNFYLVKKYTNSLGDKANLRQDIKGWLGRDLSPDECINYDYEELVGKQCILSVVHSDDGRFANINSISSPITGLSVVHDMEIPDWITKTVEKARISAVKTVPDHLKQFVSGNDTISQEKSFIEQNKGQSGDFNDEPVDGVPW